MKIALAQIWQETNTFSPISTDLKSFEQNGLYFGAQILEQMRGVGELGGFVAAAEEEADRVELLPILRAWAMSSGRVTSRTLSFLEEQLIRGLRKAKPIDGIFLSMHGAAASEKVADLEGHLLSAVRGEVGDDIPLVLSLDHHANVTERIICSTDALVGYQTQPHDPYETGKRAARILFAALRGDIVPSAGWQKIPMIAPADRGHTSEWPMKAWFDLARAMEKQPGVISCSTFPVQPWLDVPELGWATVAITDNKPGLAYQLAAGLANMAWELRDEFWVTRRLQPEEVIRRAVQAQRGPIIICDASDSVLSGAPGDSTCLVKEMLRQRIQCIALLPMVDPELVEQAIAAGVGNEIKARVGGKLDCIFNEPVPIRGKVIGIVEEGLSPSLHWGSSSMGRTVLIEVGSIKMLVSEQGGTGGTDPETYRHFGIEPAHAKIIVVKTYYHYEHFRSILKDVFMADCPGLSTWDLRGFDWKNAPRPLFPLDDLPDWHPIIPPH
jgi:microcystin degradation protein MlrC